MRLFYSRPLNIYNILYTSFGEHTQEDQDMKELRNKVAAVTGAASGIGRMLAINLAKEGCHLAISDINEAGLKETAEMIGHYGGKISVHVVDVAQREKVYRYADDVVAKHGRVHILINNAGVTIAETLEETNYEDFEWLLAINLWGVIYGCKAFLPYLKNESEANIVNVSSVYGIFTFPNNGAYCTSKFAIRGFTETLCQELKATQVRVSCVHPGGIKTNIVHNARFYKAADSSLNKAECAELFDRFLAHTSAEKAARIIILGIKKDKARIMIGRDAYLFDWLKRLFPIGFQRMMSNKEVSVRIKNKIRAK
jgi:NAD(P)-dependent dehydrogenase (short-subunit alcohol dehydrogenase family)